MQINVVKASDPGIFNRLLFPEAPPEAHQWIKEQFHRDTSMLTDIGRSFVQKANVLYDKLMDPSLMRRARQMVRGVKGIFHPNTILPVSTVSEVQAAKPVMQRYVMACPSIRKLYHQQLCDGYSDSYIDHAPTDIGSEHYDYRRVMNGAVETYKKENGDESWRVTMYPDDLFEGDRELDTDEKFAIRGAWDLVKLAIGLKKDPTDIFNGDLEV